MNHQEKRKSNTLIFSPHPFPLEEQKIEPQLLAVVLNVRDQKDGGIVHKYRLLLRFNFTALRLDEKLILQYSVALGAMIIL